MVYALKPIHSVTEVQAHEEKYGTYNHYPPGWKSITAEQFGRSAFFTYGFLRTEYRQMYIHPDGTRDPTMFSAQLFFHAQGCFALARDQDQKVLYFQFGCDHDWKHANRAQLYAHNLSIGHMENAMHCAKCDSLWIFDSSD